MKITIVKKHFLVILMSWFFSNPFFAQYNPEVNSLIKDVKEASFADSATLFKKGQQAIAKISSTKYKGAIAEVYIYYANYFYYTRNIDQAKKYFKEAESKAQTLSNKHIETLANIRLMFIDYELGINESAEQDLLNLLLVT